MLWNAVLALERGPCSGTRSLLWNAVLDWGGRELDAMVPWPRPWAGRLLKVFEHAQCATSSLFCCCADCADACKLKLTHMLFMCRLSRLQLRIVELQLFLQASLQCNTSWRCVTVSVAVLQQTCCIAVALGASPVHQIVGCLAASLAFSASVFTLLPKGRPQTTGRTFEKQG